MKKNFLHIYEELDIMHLGKPQGMYCTYMHNLGWDTSIVTYDLKNELENEFRGVKIDKIKQFMPFLPNESFTKFIKRLPLYWYIYKNAKNVDLLMLYHATVCSYWNAFFYRLGNPKGKIFIKGDFDKELYLSEIEWSKKTAKNLKEIFRKRRWVRAYKKRKELIEMADVYSVETLEGFEELYNNGYNGMDIKNKLLNLPNGVDLKFIEDNKIVAKQFEEKENIIFTASRIGNKRKNTEFFLEVIKKVNLKDWKVVLAGPIEESFKLYMENFFKENPELKEKIIFLDFIKDKNILYKYYNSAKIFMMTSREEGFANVFLEALYFGDYIITTRVSSATDVTDYEKVGAIIEQNDLDNFVEKLSFAMENKEFLKNKYHDTKELSKKFIWENVVQKLSHKILGLMDK